MKLTQLFLCTAALALPLSLHAATQKSADRWFEIEIILFSQLGDKSQLKESFPDTSALTKHRRAEDLLYRYLNPDIRGLKQLLPSCDAPSYVDSLMKKNAKLPALFNEKSLTELAKSSSELNVAEPSTLQDSSDFSDATNNPTLLATVIKSTKLAVDNAHVTNALSNEKIASSEFDHNAAPFESKLSTEERAKIKSLVLAAEVEFQGFKFQYTPTVEPLLLCRIDEAYFAEYQANTPNFDYHGFTVDKMPLLIDAIEEIDNHQTHLLSKDSLQLDDVIKDLRYSKNFRPLLHMGWRQVARPEKQSVPVRVYAGENFAADHQKKLARFNKQKSLQIAPLLSHASEQNPVTSMSEQNHTEQILSEKQARIQQIITKLPQVNENTEDLLASFGQQDLSLTLASAGPLEAAQQIPPLAPVQQWFIDGFFNVHLKHYLFITADFNVLDQSLAELATAQLSATAPTNVNANTSAKASQPIQAKAIRFKQNRRVISGEVHYFDHPYMGMVVQIRPYTKPEIAEIAEIAESI